MLLCLLSWAATFSLARGMCFGVSLMQQAVVCPEPKVYYPQLCICLEPKNVDRFNEIGSFREVPILKTGGYMDSPQNMKSKLDALRHRLTASLPDVSTHGFGSSLGDVRLPLIVFPDGYVMPSSKFYTFQNQVPRSWRIGGLLESWSNDAFAAGEIPAVNTGGMFSSATSGWGTILEDLSTLSLMERLHTLRNLWRNTNQANAESKRGDVALAQQFFKNLPTTGISPDTARSFHHYDASGPDTTINLDLKYKQPQTDSMKVPLLETTRNSFTRGSRRLRPSENL